MNYWRRTRPYWFGALFVEGMLYLKAGDGSGSEAIALVLMLIILIFIYMGCASSEVDKTD